MKRYGQLVRLKPESRKNTSSTMERSGPVC